MKRAGRSEDAAGPSPGGALLLVGGRMGRGSPQRLMPAGQEGGIGGLAVVCDHLSSPEKGIGRPAVSDQVSRAENCGGQNAAEANAAGPKGARSGVT
jgi:acetate CoA/acetoacetate CoA-transferase alpha subunit